MQNNFARTLADHWLAYGKRTESFPRLLKPIESYFVRANIKRIFLEENLFPKGC